MAFFVNAEGSLASVSVSYINSAFVDLGRMKL